MHGCDGTCVQSVEMCFLLTFFHVVLGTLVQDGLMSKEDVHEVQKEVETYDWQRGLHLMCRIQCIKEPTVIARTVEILVRFSLTNEEDSELTILRGGNIQYISLSSGCILNHIRQHVTPFVIIICDLVYYSLHIFNYMIIFCVCCASE